MFCIERVGWVEHSVVHHNMHSTHCCPVLCPLTPAQLESITPLREHRVWGWRAAARHWGRWTFSEGQSNYMHICSWQVRCDARGGKDKGWKGIHCTFIQVIQLYSSRLNEFTGLFTMASLLVTSSFIFSTGQIRPIRLRNNPPREFQISSYTSDSDAPLRTSCTVTDRRICPWKQRQNNDGKMLACRRRGCQRSIYGFLLRQSPAILTHPYASDLTSILTYSSSKRAIRSRWSSGKGLWDSLETPTRK